MATTHQTENTEEVIHEGAHMPTLYAEPLFHIGPENSGLTVTNALFTGWIAVAIILVMVLIIRIRLREVPGKFQSMIETLIDGALELADQVTGSRKITEKVFPLAIAIFFFVLINNWLGIMPFGALGLQGNAFVPFLRSGTADINTTLALAVVAVIGANIFGILSIGAWKTFNKYVNLKALGTIPIQIRKDPSVVLVAPVTFFVGILELVGEFAKVASLSFRLFGNVFAGEVLLASMAALLAYLLPIPFLGLELFVGLIQALIFSMLTLVYFSIAAQDHEASH